MTFVTVFEVYSPSGIYEKTFFPSQYQYYESLSLAFFYNVAVSSDRLQSSLKSVLKGFKVK